MVGGGIKEGTWRKYKEGRWWYEGGYLEEVQGG